MSMREVDHGGVIKTKPAAPEQRPPFDAYGIDPTVEHGGVILPPDSYNGIKVLTSGEGVPGKYFPPVPFTPAHGGVQEAHPEDYVPPQGDQP